jgi:hypothetical protein
MNSGTSASKSTWGISTASWPRRNSTTLRSWNGRPKCENLNWEIGKCENVKIEKAFVQGDHFHISIFSHFPIFLLFVEKTGALIENKNLQSK